MTPDPGSARAREERKSEIEEPSEPARLRKALSERLTELEQRIEHEEEVESTETSGSIGQFVGDVARETRDAGSRLWTRLARPRAVASRLLTALTTSEPDPEAGVDEDLRDAVAEAVRPMARTWLGLRIHADIPLPHRGGVFIALNRSGWPLPTEGMIVASALAERARRRDVYVLWSGDLLAAPGIGTMFRRLGVLPVARGEARRLLGEGAMVLGFPEGAAATDKNYARRYRVSTFADDYLIDEVRDSGAALVPGAILGHEESHPVLARIGSIPLTPTFPFTGALGLLPLPLGWKIHIGVPLHTDERGGSNAELTAQLRGRMQGMLSEMVGGRRSIVRG